MNFSIYFSQQRLGFVHPEKAIRKNADSANLFCIRNKNTHKKEHGNSTRTPRSCAPLEGNLWGFSIYLSRPIRYGRLMVCPGLVGSMAKLLAPWVWYFVVVVVIWHKNVCKVELKECGATKWRKGNICRCLSRNLWCVGNTVDLREFALAMFDSGCGIYS